MTNEQLAILLENKNRRLEEIVETIKDHLRNGTATTIKEMQGVNPFTSEEWTKTEYPILYELETFLEDSNKDVLLLGASAAKAAKEADMVFVR